MCCSPEPAHADNSSSPPTGALAGMIGTAGGITSLVFHPVLPWAGVPPLQVSVANIIAQACWPESAVASRPELEGNGPWLRRRAIVAAAGGTADSSPGTIMRVAASVSMRHAMHTRVG
jgi:uncharacterized protein